MNPSGDVCSFYGDTEAKTSQVEDNMVPGALQAIIEFITIWVILGPP
jgi:hypothetical protein